ncbi:MAG: VCBS repeat-containing protein [Bacteroidetes bacterium]|nr:VCBS repeat-containing protein [Bacteroidota bacterium]
MSQQLCQNKVRFGALFIFVILLLISCQEKEQPTLFTLLPEKETGVEFTNLLKEDTAFNIIEYLYFYNGAGVAAGDINNDGLVDLYFSSNQNSNRLYLNRGNFKFEDITVKSNTQGVGNWKTGVTMADVNGDGFLDIYVCGVGKYKKFNSRNQLLINNHDLTFTDKTEEYGLNFQGFSTQAVFFDYDLDGDLDCYLLNHSVHSSRAIGNVSKRFTHDSLAGDKLFENLLFDHGKKGDGHFKEVTEKAGILNSAIGYGLGVSVSDINLDGYPDIYVSNDFQENDYLYLNNKNGTFRQVLEKSLGHSSRFSMGNDVADFNNDARPDLLTLDMLPSQEDVIKTSAGDDPYEIYRYKLKSGFYYQTARNCLQLNQFVSDTSVLFSDIAWQANVAATDWSWSPLMADFDNDGWKDILITNGIMRRPNDMDYITYISDQGVQEKLQKMDAEDMKVLEQMPAGKVSNFGFKNSGQWEFKDMTSAWGLERASFSNGAAYADLDNDGDLDLAINNINEPAFIYRNNSVGQSFLKIVPQGKNGNNFGIGVKVLCYSGGKKFYYEVSSTRGFSSSVDTRINIGLGPISKIDSLFIVWPSGKTERKANVLTNQTLTAKESDATLVFDFAKSSTTKFLVNQLSRTEIPDFRHREDDYNAFTRENLMPQMLTNEGPPLAVADVDGDGLDDVFVGGGKGQSGVLFFQRNGAFQKTYSEPFEIDSASEDVDAAFFDADSDGDKDLVVVGGGQEVKDKNEVLRPRLYLNSGRGNFVKREDFAVNLFLNASCVKPADFDNDGDTDLFIGASAMPLLYGMSPASYLLVNDGKGNFQPKINWLGNSQFSNIPPNRIGMIKDAAWTDLNKDGLLDLVAVGEWMPVTVLIQQPGNIFMNETSKWGLANSSGWWNTIEVADFDHDGDDDFVLGNMGLNTRLKTSDKKPLKMILGDFDGNGSSDHILLYFNGDKSYPFATRDQLVKQVPYLKKKFLNYKDYRNVTTQDILSPAQEGQSAELRINELRSVYLRNDGTHLISIPLPQEAQVSPVEAIATADINDDGHTDILLGGNLRTVQTELGPYDASLGLILLGDGKGKFNAIPPSESGFVVKGEIRSIRAVKTSGKGIIFLASRNNDKIIGFRSLSLNNTSLYSK